jgi:hypothetical protein
MDVQTLLTFLIVFALVGGIAAAFIALRVDREQHEEPIEYAFTAASEGMTRCRRCGMGNLVTDSSCVSCGAALPHSAFASEARIR